ncbi:MAG: PLP-dependent aminotransferase family protein [Proteobacteria bacterium]|nr:PLP-dependent aminotransferase family protein [Pseudomonadota bacterium]MCP4918176.1 PLP-dependent aminotransferase family protein [Pseudomonadota bacterium]
MPLYEDVADRLQDLVETGTFRTGQKLPSVRGLHRDWGVSKSTVLEAYRILEDRGVIEVRPQSGHYVKAHAQTPEPTTGVGPGLDVSDLMVRVTMRAGPEGFVGLGCGLPDADQLPLDQLDRLMARVARERQGHSYQMGTGHPRLRQALARRAMAAGCTLGPDDLVVTTGCQEALDLSFRVLCRRGDRVAVGSPTYVGLLEILRAQGIEAVEIPSSPRTGMDVDALAQVLPTVQAVAVAPNFNNPQGSLMTDRAKEQLVRICAAADVPLVEDEAYGDLGFDGSRPRSLKSWDITGIVLSCGTLSKTVSPGLRLGWVAGGRYTGQLARLKMVSSLACATVPQLTAAEFLLNGGYERHLRRLRRAYRDHVGRMSATVAASFPLGTGISRPRGGQFVWLQLPHGDALELFERAWDEGISVAPGPMFSATGGHRRCIRLNATAWTPEAQRAVVRVGALASGA